MYCSVFLPSSIPGSCWHFHGRVWDLFPPHRRAPNSACGPAMWMIHLWVWPHGRDTLQDFLNEQHPSIKFTMEVEEDGKILFLDVGISRNPDGSLQHNVYRKPTHTDRYLNQRSFHHPSMKSSVNGTPRTTRHTTYATRAVYPTIPTAHRDYPPAQRLQTQQYQHIEACPQTLTAGYPLYPKSNPPLPVFPT